MVAFSGPNRKVSTKSILVQMLKQRCLFFVNYPSIRELACCIIAGESVEGESTDLCVAAMAERT